MSDVDRAYFCCFCLNPVYRSDERCSHCHVCRCQECGTYLPGDDPKFCNGCGTINPKVKINSCRQGTTGGAYLVEAWQKRNKGRTDSEFVISSGKGGVFLAKRGPNGNYNDVRELTEEERKTVGVKTFAEMDAVEGIS